jgi:MFS family permease
MRPAQRAGPPGDTMQRSSAVTPDDAIYRKIARRIVPFLFICYVVNFIDRVNIGFAKLQFLQDLKLDDAVFGLAAGMFFVGYLVFELPSNLLLERIGVRKTLLRIMVLWGGLTVLLMFVKSASMLYLLRFLLGAAEAGFFPGIILYLTYWFPDRQRGRITSLFIMAVPLAGIIGGPLSGWIMVHFHDMLGLHGWHTGHRARCHGDALSGRSSVARKMADRRGKGPRYRRA